MSSSRSTTVIYLRAFLIFPVQYLIVSYDLPEKRNGSTRDRWGSIESNKVASSAIYFSVHRNIFSKARIIKLIQNTTEYVRKYLLRLNITDLYAYIIYCKFYTKEWSYHHPFKIGSKLKCLQKSLRIKEENYYFPIFLHALRKLTKLLLLSCGDEPPRGRYPDEVCRLNCSMMQLLEMSSIHYGLTWYLLQKYIQSVSECQEQYN